MVGYTYETGGRLKTRTWARGPVTTYTYYPTTKELWRIVYDDGTPTVEFTYDDLGRQKLITDAFGTREFFYTDKLQLDYELLNGVEISRKLSRYYDAIGRPEGAGLNSGGMEEEVILPLTPGFPRACAHILDVAESGMGAEAADLAGLGIRGEDLVIAVPEGGAYLEHDLPAGGAGADDADDADEVLAWAEDLNAEPEPNAEDEDEIDPNSATNAELKHLVMTNIQSISILLGFLRNHKIVAIPGLVEDVVNRTRNPKVIETIAMVRVMHTGFANRGVPLACLRSPVNIPIGVLRKFMHVKYVSKVDLKRIAVDQAGVRKEVGREVKKYLKTLT